MSSRVPNADVSGRDHGATLHAYPGQAALLAAVRAGLGIAATLAIWGLLGMGWPVTIVASLVVLMFAAYGLRSVRRLCRPLRMTGERLEAATGGPGVALDRLRELKLAYYSTRRDGENGWMELKLRDDQGGLVVESEIAGFRDIVTAAVKAAGASGLAFSEATQRNLESLMRAPDAEGAAPLGSRSGARRYSRMGMFR